MTTATTLDKFNPEPYIEKYGEKYRQMIVESLKWLSQQSYANDLNIDKFLQDLIEHSVD